MDINGVLSWWRGYHCP